MAFLKSSRYGALDRFDGTSPFQGIRPRPITPATPVLEHTIALKDRLDVLAQNFYRNPRDWTRLAEANTGALFAEDLIWDPEPEEDDGQERMGSVLLIPRRQEERG